jgi:NTE family protein
MQNINLALQGGGSHGAFTWGVLDMLLEDGRLGLEGISGTSAGAMNAVALAHGLTLGEKGKKNGDNTEQREAARAFLAKFWADVTSMDSANALQRNMWSLMLGGWRMEQAPTNMFADAAGQLFSPYQTNPLDINPLRWSARLILSALPSSKAPRFLSRPRGFPAARPRFSAANA